MKFLEKLDTETKLAKSERIASMDWWDEWIAKEYIGSISEMDFNEYRIRRKQAKSVIQRAINSGQIRTNDSGAIDYASFQEWMSQEKIQAGFYIRREIWEKFKLVNDGKNLSFEIEKLIAGSLE